MVLDDWLVWLHDFRTDATEFVQNVVAAPEHAKDAELQSIRFAVYARLLSLLDTAVRHAEADKQLGCELQHVKSSNVPFTLKLPRGFVGTDMLTDSGLFSDLRE